MTAGVPGVGTEAPDVVAAIAGGDPIETVWQNELNGLTFRSRGSDDIRYIKWQPIVGLDSDRYSDVSLRLEAEKLRWAGQFIRVPNVLDSGGDCDHEWLVTEGIDAVSAFDLRWRDEPETAVIAIATGLRRLHDALPVTTCPYREGIPSATDVDASELVVTHGDPCVPNTLISVAGEFVGHVDLGRLRVADRWADLAIATYSISWDINFGRDYDDLFCDVYGVEPDHERMRVYRELYDSQ